MHRILGIEPPENAGRSQIDHKEHPAGATSALWQRVHLQEEHWIHGPELMQEWSLAQVL